MRQRDTTTSGCIKAKFHYAIAGSRLVRSWLPTIFEPVCDRRSPPPGQISPHRCNNKDIGPSKLKTLMKFDQTLEYKRPTEAYPLSDFHEICRACIPFHNALAVKTWMDLLNGLQSYGGGVLSSGAWVSPKFSALSLVVKLCIVPQKF